MTVHQALVLDQCVGVSLTTVARGLTAIKDPACSAVIWKREPAQGFQTWIDGLGLDELPRTRITLRSEMVRDAMADVMQACGLADCKERAMFVDDIAALSAMFSSIMDSRYIRLRLDAIDTNACRKFHIDAVTARLICTYRGPATQYGNGEMGSDPIDFHEVPIGSPMILRGSQWPSAVKPGLLHRSPPIEGTGETRLVLVLDPVSDLETQAVRGERGLA